MTLDDAIKHAEEVADSHDRIKQIKAVTLEECKYAEEHRQLAEWLRELKQLKEQEFYVTTREPSDDELNHLIEQMKKEMWQLVSVEQDPCDDAISRKAAIDAMIKIEQDDINQYGCEIPEGFDSGPAIEALNGLQPVTPSPKTGHWIRWYEQKEYDWGVDNIPHCKCSECGKEYDSHSSQFIKYCCECGVKMAESEE